jgi:hypothetical protein
MKNNNKKRKGDEFLADTFTVGNLKVTKLVDQSQIQAFVDTLPPEKKADMKDVIMALHQEGLIDIEEM